MTTDQLTAPDAAVRTEWDTRTAPVAEVEPLAVALRRSAERRRDRAGALRAWARDVHPELGTSLCRRAAELELGAVALELRADGMDAGGAATQPRQEEER